MAEKKERDGRDIRDVRLQGPLAVKTDGFLSKRIIDMPMRDAVFGEARRAFVNRDDDECPWDGQWRGEFWGKSMICAARASDYLGNIERTESNAIGGVGISDRLLGAENFPYASTEVCDVVHWIRLNVDLYLVTGDDRYLNAIEFSYFNAYLASIYRNFAWAPLVVRDAGRHRHSLGQCGYSYNHCCVDNVARSIFDVASIVVTREENGTFHVNLYQDATVALDGIRFEITGNYPANKCVSVKVQGRLPDGSVPKVCFRKPDWCPALDVSRDADGTYRLTFDMNPRLVERIAKQSPATAEAAKTRAFGADRYIFVTDTDLRKSLPTEAYATLMWGPLVLARSVRLGARRQDLEEFKSVNGKGCQVRVEPIAAQGVYAPFAVEIVKPGKETVFTKACSYESAGDDPAGRNGYIFSVRF